MLKDRLNQDIKTALLAGNKGRAEVLKGLKSAILYEEVAQKSRDEGLSEEKILAVLAREAKKRAESAEIYAKAGDQERAGNELAEKEIIDSYLPKQLTDEELNEIVASVMAELGSSAQMGQIIGAVKAKAGALADGARVAAAVKTKLGS